MQKVSVDKFFIFAKATNISIFKQTFGWQVFQTANWACLQSVIAKRLTRTEKLNFDTKVQFSDKFSFRGDNYKIKLLSIVLTSLNSVDLTADNKLRLLVSVDLNVELTKRIDLCEPKLKYYSKTILIFLKSVIASLSLIHISEPATISSSVILPWMYFLINV